MAEMPKHVRRCHGDQCPSIAIGDEANRIVLKDVFEKTPLVLIFYSGDFSPQAITLLKRFTAEYEEYKKAGFALMGIGTGSETTRTAFIKKYAIPFPCVHDAKKAASKAFLVTKKVGSKLSMVPHVFVINTDGVICFAKKGYPKRSDILKLCK